MEGLSDQELKRLILSVGTHASHRPLSPAEVSDLIARAVSEGSTRAECASRLRIGTSQMASFLRLQELDNDLRHLATWGNQPNGIPFSSLAVVAQLSKRFEQQRAAELIIEHGLTWRETVQLVQIAQRSGSGVQEASKRVLDLRPEVETRHVIIGSIMSGELQSALAELSQQDRDEWMERALSDAGLRPEITGRLGTRTFTIVAKSHIDPDTVEAQINDLLRQLLQV